MISLPTIEFATTRPSVVINGLVVLSAPTMEEICSVIGLPSRVDSGEQPAPHGHRNSQRHVYDDIGIHFTEHHHTRRAIEVCCWYEVSEPIYRFTPKHPFTGTLTLNNVQMPAGGRDVQYLASSPLEFQQQLRGSFQFELSGFTIILNSIGQRLSSGRRSQIRRVMLLSFSWPHDNWGEPAIPNGSEAS